MDKDKEIKPTETYMYKNTKVNVYGKLNVKKLAQIVYELNLKYK